MQSTDDTANGKDAVAIKLVVLSGKGGVGKSTVAANAAVLLALKGYKVGVMDVDLHGPSLPKLLGLQGQRLRTSNGKILPAQIGDNLKVVSIGLLFDCEDDPIIWRGPLKMNAVKQFVENVDWGHLDCLVVDCPPGTGDEPLSVIQLIGEHQHAIIVSTPQDVALADVRKSVSFCRRLDLPILGIIENMSGFVCPHCGNIVHVFGSGGAERMAAEMNVPFLGKIPLDPQVVESGDSGHPYVYHYSKAATAKLFEEAMQPAVELMRSTSRIGALGKRNDVMNGSPTKRIAIPTYQGKLCAHFGHCEAFTVLDIDIEAMKVTSSQTLTPPEHAPGVYPRWVKELGADTVIAGGMGSRAQALFEEQGIEVVVGADAGDPEQIALDYVQGRLATGDNVCDH